MQRKDEMAQDMTHNLEVLKAAMLLEALKEDIPQLWSALERAEQAIESGDFAGVNVIGPAENIQNAIDTLTRLRQGAWARGQQEKNTGDEGRAKGARTIQQLEVGESAYIHPFVVFLNFSTLRIELNGDCPCVEGYRYPYRHYVKREPEGFYVGEVNDVGQHSATFVKVAVVSVEQRTSTLGGH